MTSQEDTIGKSGEAPKGEQQPDQDMYATPSEILAEAVAKLLNEPGIAKSIAEVISTAAKNKSLQPNLAKTSWGLGLLFSLLVFVGIGLLGWLKVIGPEATTGLIGALVGYWYGREKSGSNR